VDNKDELKGIQELLNKKPRKCINYTPQKKEKLFGAFT